MQKLIQLITITFLFSFGSSQAAQYGPDFQDIYAYALLANAAYQQPSEINTAMTGSEFTLTAQDELPGYGVSYFIITDDSSKKHIVVIRGTSNVENAMVDVAFQLVEDDHTGIKLHQGFANSAGFLYQRVRSKLNKDYRIDTTGHSLGGAVALVLAMHLDTDGFDVGKVITFGQPKVTNVGGSRRYGHLDVTRIVTPKDMVPLVPPVDPMSIFKLDIYWHQGKEIVLLEDDSYRVLEGINSIMRAADVMMDMPSETNLQHHMMSAYLGALRPKLGNTGR